jgi:hypothetical protein
MNANVDSFEVEIDGLGDVMTYNFTSDSLKGEILLTYYEIPLSKRSKSDSKLAELAANKQIDIWKNNSKIVGRNVTKNGSAIITDVRLHMLIEDFYMQVIIIVDKNQVFEFTHIQDKNDIAAFDKLAGQIGKKDCGF